MTNNIEGVVARGSPLVHLRATQKSDQNSSTSYNGSEEI